MTDKPKKLIKKPVIQVRQTLTSKLRQERGNKVEFLKKNIEVLNKSLNVKDSLKLNKNKSQEIKKSKISEKQSSSKILSVNLKPKINKNLCENTVKTSKVIQKFEENTLRRSKSLLNLHISVAKQKNVHFKSPVASPPSIRYPTTPAERQMRLRNWLHKNEKPLDAYHHLFQLDNYMANMEQDNKENIPYDLPALDDSCEDLREKKPAKDVLISKDSFSLQAEQGDKRENDQITTNEINRFEKAVAKRGKEFPYDTKYCYSLFKDALNTILKMINDGYNRDECECWVKHLEEYCQEIKMLRVYWECRAALEEAYGNYKSSMEYFSESINIGAKEKCCEDVEQLAQMFNQINISPVKKPADFTTNVFKSSVINFKVLTKKTSNAKEQMIVTPIRRSTRKSQTCPDFKQDNIYSTLRDLDSSIEFQYNKAFR